MDSYGASLGEQSHQAVQHPSTAAAPHVAVAAFARHFSRGRAAAKAHPARAWVPWSALNGMDGQKHSCIMHANNLEFRTCFSFNPLPKFSGWEAKQKM